MEAKQRFDKKWTVAANGCWEWQAAKQANGYGKFFVGVGLGHMTAHRMAYVLYKGVILPGMHILHRCDNRGCVNPGHLFLGTNMDNIRDKVAKGRSPRGLQHGLGKLSSEQVAFIRATKGNTSLLAKQWGVHRGTITNIRSGKERKYG